MCHRFPSSFLALSTIFVAACSASTSKDDVTPLQGTPPAASSSEEPQPTGESPKPVVDPPAPCSGKPGTFHDVALESGGETRHYWLHVPESYRCELPAALVMDFHGTGFGSETDTVEESWATPELVAASDEAGFIVVRPRSRSKSFTGGFVYQWDINPGDLARNKTFATELAAHLRTQYNVQSARMYATGFSNGPTMAAQFLGDEPSLFHGFGLVAGGLNANLTRSVDFSAANAPRIYTMTGFRDYMLLAKDLLEGFLSRYAFPTDHRFDREADTGHEVYGWHFREAFAWMDKGTRPGPGQLKAEWTAETGAGSESLVEVSTDNTGSLVAVGAKGGIYTRAAVVGAGGAVAWTSRGAVPSIAPLTDVCFLPDGRGFVVGHGMVASSASSGSTMTWGVLPKLPEYGSKQMGFTWATTLGCTSDRITVGGFQSSATSTDGGKTWGESDSQQAFMSSVRASSFGWLATGYWNYSGRSSDGVSFEQASMPGETQWWNDGSLPSATKRIVVGEGGAIGTSNDSGATWTTNAASLASASSATTKEDLYAVTFRGLRGAAVGAHGTVIVTSDGGATWTDRSTGLSGFLGGARFTDDQTLVVVGEHGAILRTTL